MNASDFLALREATAPVTYTDEVMRFYWAKLIGTATDNTEFIEDGTRADYDPINWASYYAKEALWGAIGHEFSVHNPTVNSANDILDFAVDYLLDSLSTNFLSLDSLFAYVNNNTIDAGRRCLDLGYTIENVSFIIDMVWEYDASIQDDLLDKLDPLAHYANWLLINTRDSTSCTTSAPYNGYPGMSITNHPGPWAHNYRIRLAGALGFAGCVLGNETI